MQPTTVSRGARRELLVIVTTIVLLLCGVLIARSTGMTGSQPIAAENATASHGGRTSATWPVKSGEANTASDWPAMTVVYRSDGTLVRLEYLDAHHWRKEILESTYNPEMVGKVITFDGMAYTESIPNTVNVESGNPALYTEVLPNGKEVPERWLRPEYTQSLEAKHFVVSAGDTSNEAVYRQVWTVPCPPAPNETDPHPPISQPAACDTGTTYAEVETYVFRTDVTPPLAIAAYTEVGGETTWQFEALEVDLSPSSVE